MKMILTRKVFVLTHFVLLTFVTAFSARAAGEVDTSFNANLIYGTSGGVSKVVVQPDGKILIGGSFRIVSGFARGGFVRLNADGTVDTTFNSPDFRTTGGNNVSIGAIALQSDGKILVGGSFTLVGSEARSTIARLNPDGTADQTFPHVVPPGSSFGVSEIFVYPDDRILFGGNFNTGTPGETPVHMKRLNADGTVDPSFNYSGFRVGTFIVQPDGRLVVASYFDDVQNTFPRITRYNADGSPDASFAQISIQANNSISEIEYLPDGKILVGGGFNLVNGFTRIGLFRANSDGTVDSTFPDPQLNSGASVREITLTPNGQFYVAGSFTQIAGTSARHMVRMNANGTRDTGFGWHEPFAAYTISSVVLLPSGNLLVGTSSRMLRVTPNGGDDTSFAVVRFESGGFGFKVVVQPDNKILVGGQFTVVNGVTRANLARLNADGTLDTGFSASVGFPLSVLYDINLQQDGKILIAGSIGDARRLNANGSADVSFAGTNGAWDIEQLPDGKILVAGESIRKYSSTGALEGTITTIGGGGSFPRIYSLVVQPDGKLVIGGNFQSVNGIGRNRIARLNADGTVDNAFNPPNGAGSNVNTVLLQPDGKILVGGDFTNIGSVPKTYLARLNSDGSIDGSFSPVLDGPVLGLKRQTDGKILIGGAMSLVNGAPRLRIARINQDGTLDTSFNVGTGVDSTVRSIDQQSDGKIIYTGYFTRTNGLSTIGIGRLLNFTVPPSKLFDYDGDGKADVSVFRPSENRWYVFRSSDSVVTQTVFAIAGDVPVPADYDGDLKTDFAIYRPSSGAWWYLSSINGTQNSVQWGGEAGDVPRPSDFDGDGKSDFVFFRPTNNFWYRISGNGTVSNVQFGSSGDKPVRGDFDGDGKFDPAIYRPSTGDWWYLSSINGSQLAVHWGISTDIPAAADFDGDGRTDFAVYRPSTGVWYILNSSNGSSTIMGFGLSEDKPVPADYDGDGKADIAVFRPSTGVWYLQRSTSGFTAMQFGVSTDIPTENAFVP